MNIDFVIPWVDGSDPVWIHKRNSVLQEMKDADECRFRDWDILKYWFRAVECYAPWVRKIHFVTDGQVPDWLNTAHPKLHILDHREYIPSEYLPTFSSHTIELNFHRIDGLSEYFVYFNDDMFLNGKVEPEDFFRNGLPRDAAILTAFHPCGDRDAYIHAQCNVMAFVNSKFDKHTVLRLFPKLWFSPVYGKYVLKNLYFAPLSGFSNFQNNHIPSSMLKSTFETLWNMEPELLDRTCRNRFRALEDVNQYIFSYYNLCSGRFVPRHPNFGKCYRAGQDHENILSDIAGGKHKVICINDNPFVQDFETFRDQLAEAFQKKLPGKSSYEI